LIHFGWLSHAEMGGSILPRRRLYFAATVALRSRDFHQTAENQIDSQDAFVIINLVMPQISATYI